MAKIKKKSTNGVRFPDGIFPGSVMAKMINISIPDATNSPSVNQGPIGKILKNCPVVVMKEAGYVQKIPAVDVSPPTLRTP
jgi:hypothetical protein